MSEEEESAQVDEAEFARIMNVVIKKSVIWYRGQDFSLMNDDVKSELQSLFSADGEEYDPNAGIQISMNMMMIGHTWDDKRLIAIAARAAEVTGTSGISGRAEGKAILRQLLDEISIILHEPKFSDG